ncbi:MAG: hypothetical protein ABR987_11355 [Terracidiphilus sp.]|jgi:hypothetical protein
MKRLANLFFLPTLCAALCAAASAQTAEKQAGGTTGVLMRDGGVSEVLQSIYIPPLLNQPFTAIVHTEWTRPMMGGGTYTWVNKRQVARDSKGRIYEERWLLVPRGGNLESRMNVIQIADPNTHISYNCFTLQTPHRCFPQEFRDTAEMVYKPAIGTTGPLPNNLGFRTHEDLGTRSIEGIETRGTRDTTNYNAGVMGSDQPFTAHREFWYATQLGINLYSEVVDPNVGKQAFTLTDVNLAEPDPKLFELPEGYTVGDNRKSGAEHVE